MPSRTDASGQDEEVPLRAAAQKKAQATGNSSSRDRQEGAPRKHAAQKRAEFQYAIVLISYFLHCLFLSCSRLGKEYTKLYGQLDPDSDYDNQDPYSPTVETDIMRLEDQDFKLRVDYLTLPHLTFTELKDPNGTYPLLLLYSAVWESMLVKPDPASRRYEISYSRLLLLICIMQAIPLSCLVHQKPRAPAIHQSGVGQSFFC
jgi:hypothetical protein